MYLLNWITNSLVTRFQCGTEVRWKNKKENKSQPPDSSTHISLYCIIDCTQTLTCTLQHHPIHFSDELHNLSLVDSTLWNQKEFVVTFYYYKGMIGRPHEEEVLHFFSFLSNLYMLVYYQNSKMHFLP